MTRFPQSLSLLAATAVIAAGANAQCYTSAGTSVTGTMIQADPGYAISDEGYTPPIPLGFAMPIPGATTGGARTHIIVGSNGEIYVTDAASSGFVHTFAGIDTLTELRGSVPRCPVIVTWGDDLDGGLNGGTWDIKVAQTATTCKVTWENVGNWLTFDEYSFSVTLDASGLIECSYDGAPDWQLTAASNSIIGVSRGATVGNGTEPSSDLSAGVPVPTADALIYQLFTVAVDVNDLSTKAFLFIPSGSGYTAVLTCQSAFHEQYGSGCYAIFGPATEAFYQVFPNTTASSAALQGNALTMVPSGNGYLSTFGAGTVHTPVAPFLVTIADDEEVNIPVSTPFPHVNGPISPVSINSNGILQMGAIPTGNDVTVYGTSAQLLADPVAAFRSNVDLDPSSGGTVSYEELTVGADTILFITWTGVPLYQLPLAVNTFEFQLTLAGPNAGRVVTVWGTVTGAQAEATVVGYAPGGGSNDGGSIVLATALPLTTSPDANVEPLTLSGSPNPVITGGSGPAVSVTYTVSNVPEFDPVAFPGLDIGACSLIWSVVGPIPGGVDLGSFPVDIGLPGCSAYVLTSDAIVDISGVIAGGPGGTLSFTIAMPAPLSPGMQFYLQALSLLPPGIPANGSNNLVGTPYGARTSNGLIIHYENQ